MTDGCDICRRIARLTSDNPFLIAELPTGYAVVGDHQLYRGYTVFVGKRCVPELHDLPPAGRTAFLEDMAVVAEAVFRAMKPRKLNYELLGNSVAHLHWHLYPRYDDDPNPTWPVWSDERLHGEPERVAPELRDELRTLIGAELARLRA